MDHLTKEQATKVHDILDNGNENYTGDQIRTKLLEAGFAIVPIEVIQTFIGMVRDLNSKLLEAFIETGRNK